MAIKMRLIIGGYAQGKLSYVLTKYSLQEGVVWDSVMPDNTALPDAGVSNDTALPKKTVVMNHFHKWVKNRMSDGGCPEEEIGIFLKYHEDCIIISDEIGNGIVPVDSFEREYRERLGRLLVRLAEKAEEVERIICGIGLKIK